jgi:hypothetical protein
MSKAEIEKAEMRSEVGNQKPEHELGVDLSRFSTGGFERAVACGRQKGETSLSKAERDLLLWRQPGLIITT